MSAARMEAARAFFTERELLDRWHISRQTLYRWRKSGYAPQPLHFAAGTVRWRFADVAEFEERLAEDAGLRRVVS